MKRAIIFAMLLAGCHARSNPPEPTVRRYRDPKSGFCFELTQYQIEGGVAMTLENIPCERLGEK